MRKHATRWLLFTALLIGSVLALHHRDQLAPERLAAWLERAGPAAPLAFILVYALGTILFVPGSLLTLAGGALFGPVLGTLYNLAGATLGAALAFLLARYLAGGWVARRTGGRLARLKTGVEKEGWRFVALTRLVPLFPFNLLNYALGLTRIPLAPYVLTSALCMAPGALAYTWLGYAGRQALTGAEGAVRNALLALALLAAAAFLPRLIKRLRQTPSP